MIGAVFCYLQCLPLLMIWFTVSVESDIVFGACLYVELSMLRSIDSISLGLFILMLLFQYGLLLISILIPFTNFLCY